MRCETCQHYIKSHQLAGDTFTRPMCKREPWGNIPSVGYCDQHQDQDSLWDDAWLRSLSKAITLHTDFIKEKEFRV